jgi:hypothetical protein
LVPLVVAVAESKEDSEFSFEGRVGESAFSGTVDILARWLFQFTTMSNPAKIPATVTNHPR